MEAAAPSTMTRWATRAVWLVMVLGPLAVFITATQITPNPSGVGTHTQLGLPPCGFLLMTGMPCPGCGLTTCFAHMVRFEIVDAARANLFGVALFIATAYAMVIAAIALVRGWGLIDTLNRFHADKWAMVLAALAVGVWAVRVAVHLA